MQENEHIAIVGQNGSGKSTLIQTITGQIFLKKGILKFDFGITPHKYNSENIRYVTFNDAYGTATSDYYYQQRWNSQDCELSPTVHSLLKTIKCDNPRWSERVYRMLDIDEISHKQLVMLSSGELRKLHIAKLLLPHPKVIILENPFIGLDTPSRALLTALLQHLVDATDIQIILAVSDSKEIPSFITHVYETVDMQCSHKYTLAEYLAKESITTRKYAASNTRVILPPYNNENLCKAHKIVQFNNVSIRYGERTIIDCLDWTIINGEKWSLSGCNGSGKSTLLSLICADNPQAYTQNITLFDHKRGTGESIWDIKRHIGYISPEMHRAYLQDIPAASIVASGYHDTIGLYRKLSTSQLENCREWLRVFGVDHLRDRSFVKLSSGEQRLLLLARAMVKNPDLLILDEPLHGLDAIHKEMVRNIITTFATQPYKTIIYVTHDPEELPQIIDKTLVLPYHI